MSRRIIPEAINDDARYRGRYSPGHWDYPTRCSNLDLALEVTRERIEEWDYAADPHGWWHERPYLIAMYNAIVGHQP